MDLVTVRKTDLIEVVKQNREKHNLIFAESVNGYWEKAQTELDKQIEKARIKDTSGLHLSLPYPTSHEKEYIRALKQLEMSVDENIELSQNEFSQLVMNDWSWKTSFINTYSTYGTSTGCAMLSGVALSF